MDLNALINSGCLSLSVIEDKFALYKENPSSVDDSWRSLFDQLESNRNPPFSESSSTSAAPLLAPQNTTGQSVVYHPHLDIGGLTDGRIYNLIEAYRTYGHLLANTNPISRETIQEPYELNLELLGFSKQDLSMPFPTCGILEEES